MADEAGETKLCTNCKRDIAVSNFMMHEMHCRRHIGLCDRCHQPFPKNELEAHFYESHAKIKCPKCSTEVEIMDLEDHEENYCEKRPMKCIYCELEFPKCELDPHLEYCGSRTEPCGKCGSYIMLKDQTKHEEDNCRKPKPATTKPAPTIKPARSDNGVMGADAFDVSAISRALNRDIGQSAVGYDTAGSNGALAARLTAQRETSRQKQTNLDKKTTSKATNLKTGATNRKKETVSRGQTETEYDRLLAMQIANDIENTSNLEDMMQAFGKHDTEISPHPSDNFNTFSDNEVSIPCEFCGQLCTADDLVQHQSSCSLDRISSMLPNHGGGGGVRTGEDIPNSYPISPNNDQAVYRDIQSPLVQQPHGLIDNLGNFQHDNWEEEVFGYLSDPSAASGDGDDANLLLPCEFCDEQFPLHTLVQHQAVCDLNRTVTPRPPSPHRRVSKQTARKTTWPTLVAEFPNLVSQYGRGGLAHDNSDDDTCPVPHSSRTNPVSHKIQKPKPSHVKNTPSSFVNLNSNQTVQNQEVKSTLRKYGVDKRGSADYYTRSSSRHSNDGGSGSTAETRSHPALMRKTSTDRTRNTLDNLLHGVDDSSSHDLLAHLGGDENRRPVGARRQKVTVTNTKTRVPGVVRAEESSYRRTSNSSNGMPGNRGSRGIEVRVRPTEADELSEMVTNTRPSQRSRANNVFNKPATRDRGERR